MAQVDPTADSGAKTITQHAIEAMARIPGCHRFDVDISFDNERDYRETRATIRLDINARVEGNEIFPSATPDEEVGDD